MDGVDKYKQYDCVQEAKEAEADMLRDSVASYLDSMIEEEDNIGFEDNKVIIDFEDLVNQTALMLAVLKDRSLTGR